LPNVTTPASKTKIFVLDTNVLLHDPQCLHKFEENTIAIPVEVLEELDGKKSAPGELGFSARKIHRDLRALFDEGLESPPELNGKGSSALSRDLPNGGRLVVVINDYMVSGDSDNLGLNRLRATLVNMEKMDSRILASVFFLKELCPDKRVILVTKDANMALKGIALGLEVEDYMNDKVTSTKLGGGCKTIEVSDEDYERFLEEHGVDLLPEQTSHLFINEYIFLSNGEISEPARYRGDGQVR
jgi:PhoH-like ATPase